MKLASVILGAVLAAGAAQAARAGEDSTHRWHGVGPAWYEVEGGLRRFAAGEEYDPLRNPGRHRAERIGQAPGTSGSLPPPPEGSWCPAQPPTRNTCSTLQC